VAAWQGRRAHWWGDSSKHLFSLLK